MDRLAAVLVLLLQSDPRDRLFAAIREGRQEPALEALADLAQGDGARAARVALAALPRARERIESLIRETLRARESFASTDSSFGFGLREEVAKERALELAAARIRETSLRALEGERIYQAILDIFRFLKPEAIPVLAAEAGRTELWPLRCEVLEALGAMGARTELEVALDRERSPACLAAALGACPTDLGAKYLAHPQWQVRLAALDALRGSKGAVGALVESMATSDLRYRLKAGATLVRLTQTELPPDAEAWRDWWTANREDFVAGAYVPGAPRAPEGPGRTVAFYDIPVRSSRVCFVIDRSRSMKEQDRFETAKRELKRLLEALPDGSRVNVIFFSGTQSCFAKSPQPLDARSRREIARFVDGSGLESATDLYGALEKSLAMVGNPDTGRLLEDGADTVVVLSDGQANSGRIIDDELIATAVCRRARYLRPVFHTVSVSSDSKVLRLLAERTGGEYRAK